MSEEISILEKLHQKIYEKEGEYPKVRHFGVILLHPEAWHNILGELYAKNIYLSPDDYNTPKFKGYKVFRTVDIKPNEIMVYYE